MNEEELIKRLKKFMYYITYAEALHDRSSLHCADVHMRKLLGELGIKDIPQDPFGFTKEWWGE